jgi:hypothetical protein
MMGRRVLVCVLLVVFLAYVSGCASILYPSRSGQTSHDGVDVGMLVLDILLTGLLGVVVDLITGAIYFPASYCIPSTGLGDADIASMYQKGDEVTLPAGGAVRFTLPVRADEGTVHMLVVEVLTDSGKSASHKEIRFTGTSAWQNLSATFDVSASVEGKGLMRVVIDGNEQARLPVSLVNPDN